MGMPGEHQIVSAPLDEIEKLGSMAEQNVICVRIETAFQKRQLIRNIALINSGIGPFVNAFCGGIPNARKLDSVAQTNAFLIEIVAPFIKDFVFPERDLRGS